MIILKWFKKSARLQNLVNSNIVFHIYFLEEDTLNVLECCEDVTDQSVVLFFSSKKTGADKEDSPSNQSILEKNPKHVSCQLYKKNQKNILLVLIISMIQLSVDSFYNNNNKHSPLLFSQWVHLNCVFATDTGYHRRRYLDNCIDGWVFFFWIVCRFLRLYQSARPSSAPASKPATAAAAALKQKVKSK